MQITKKILMTTSRTAHADILWQVGSPAQITVPVERLAQLREGAHLRGAWPWIEQTRCLPVTRDRLVERHNGDLPV